MLAGMAYELEMQWRRDDAATTARESEHYRAAVESMEARSDVARQAGSSPRVSDRLIRVVRSWTASRPPAPVCPPRVGQQPDPAH
jgi:hypothetical protein